ncbi:hypothetical protein C5167_023266, partial [Papaver somniferum]
KHTVEGTLVIRIYYWSWCLGSCCASQGGRSKGKEQVKLMCRLPVLYRRRIKRAWSDRGIAKSKNVEGNSSAGNEYRWTYMGRSVSPSATHV